MNCPRCGNRVSILETLTGRKHSCDMESETRQHVWIERLLNATPRGGHELKKLLRSNQIPDHTVKSTSNAESTHLPAGDAEPTGAHIPCMLARGDWHCRCPSCLTADKPLMLQTEAIGSSQNIPGESKPAAERQNRRAERNHYEPQMKGR